MQLHKHQERSISPGKGWKQTLRKQSELSLQFHKKESYWKYKLLLPVKVSSADKLGGPVLNDRPFWLFVFWENSSPPLLYVWAQTCDIYLNRAEASSLIWK